MAEPELFHRIREELKQTVRLLLDQLRRDHPHERVYAILFDVDVSGTYAIRVAGSEEALTRLAEKYAAQGYRVESDDSQEALRALLRWDAPGDDLDGWYWGNQDDDLPVTQTIGEGVQAGLIEEYGENQPLRALCIAALRELDREGAFGTGLERERLLIGPSSVDSDFGLGVHRDELSALNPPATIRRLDEELQAAAAADQLLIRPRFK